MRFRTEVEIEKPDWGIGHGDKLLLLGSCFADNIGEKLERAGFDTLTNPFGTLYNPASVAGALERLLDARPFDENDLQDFGIEGWGVWDAHSLLCRPKKEEALQVLNARFAEASEQLRNASVLIVTFGTAWVYRLKETNTIVANCHHEPASRFVREKMSVEEIIGLWTPLLERLHTAHPALRVLFTVSPIRHLKDGAHGNQLSKATLLLAVEGLISKVEGPQLAYFPAYELVLDELRDYRFYADDMVHPSQAAVGFLWEKFSDTFFNTRTREEAAKAEKLAKVRNHRPLHATTNNIILTLKS